ncbi:unnamed protein product [Phytophthora fragariaefolia]|uniref:Unnamed protein product n=1 Tax=Phytophthora fragariaefolia TaxID=1490495 RepID=A0A9W6YAJ3_9STRA|nr:unnamed protein product [Phytophthora fragariaefolia]
MLQQPKSIGLSKRAFSNVPKASSGSDSEQVSQQLSGSDLLGYQTAIGDGQSYVNPQLLRHAPDPSKTKDSIQVIPPPTISRTVTHQKRSLGSLLMSTSKSSMVNTTSSISRPFTAPKMLNGGSSIDSAIVVEDDNPQSWKSAKQQFATKNESGTAHEKVFAAEFPAVARKVLQASDIPRLYAFVRQLHAGEDVDTALSGICDLLRDPACKELLDLMPKVFSGPICDQFIEAAKNHGLDIADNTRSSSVQVRSSDMSTFFERLQQKRRKTQHPHIPTAAIVKDPQCVVCYDITRKAFASPQCGHICCHPCWKKVITDGCDVPWLGSWSKLIIFACQSINADGKGWIYLLPGVQGPNQAGTTEFDSGSERFVRATCHGVGMLDFTSTYEPRQIGMWCD